MISAHDDRRSQRFVSRLAENHVGHASRALVTMAATFHNQLWFSSFVPLLFVSQDTHAFIGWVCWGGWGVRHSTFPSLPPELCFCQCRGLLGLSVKIRARQERAEARVSAFTIYLHKRFAQLYLYPGLRGWDTRLMLIHQHPLCPQERHSLWGDLGSARGARLTLLPLPTRATLYTRPSFFSPSSI